MTLTKSVLRATSWTAFSQVIRQVSQLAVTLVLARLLAPDDFGVVALATVVTGFVILLSDLGTSAAVIQKTEHSPGFLSSVFWLNIAFSAIVMVAVMAVSPLIAWFYHEPRLIPVLVALSISFPLTALVAPQRALLEKAMNFDLLARVEVLSTLIGGGIGVGVALSGGGVWALVLQALATVAVMALLLWLQSGWRPRFKASVSEIRSIIGFSGYLTGFNIVNYFARNADYMLIGWLLGREALGYYTMAYRILMFPLQNLSAVITRVTLPAFSRIQEDDARLRRAYLTAIGAIAIVSFPLMAGMLVVAEPFVMAGFGKQWLPMVPVLMIFSPIGLMQSIVSTAGALYIAKNKTGVLFRWGLFSSVVVVASFVIGLSWGIVGVAACYGVASLVLAYPGMAIPLRLIGLKVKDSMAVLWRPFVSALLMAVLVWLIGGIASPLVAAWKVLLIDAAIGGAIYLLLSLFINSDQLQMLQGLFTRRG
jgi:O-antigen/teichoic acid export membrane protein